MNMAHGCGFPTHCNFWTGTYFEYIPNGFQFQLVPSTTIFTKVNKRDYFIDGKITRFPKPKRRMIYFPIDISIYANYIKNYKGKEPFKNSPPLGEIIQLAYKIQQQ
jgi:hypothetical protein